MCVALIATLHFAVVRFVARVYVAVLLSIRAVGESAITAFIFALEWFLSCKE